jgi:hypothetical protein
MGNQNTQSIPMGAADADYSAKQYYLVDVSSTGIVLCSAAGQKGLPLLNKPTQGQECDVAYSGVARVIFGGTVTRGMMLKSDSSGRAVEAEESVVDTQAGSATDPVIGSYVVGIALTGGAVNQYGDMLILPMGAVPTTAA